MNPAQSDIENRSIPQDTAQLPNQFNNNPFVQNLPTQTNAINPFEPIQTAPDQDQQQQGFHGLIPMLLQMIFSHNADQNSPAPIQSNTSVGNPPQ